MVLLLKAKFNQMCNSKFVMYCLNNDFVFITTKERNCGKNTSEQKFWSEPVVDYGLKELKNHIAQ